MTNDLLKLKEEKLIFVDIETVREFENLEETNSKWDEFQWKTRNRETDELLPPEKLKELYNKKAGLYSTHSKIVAITCGFVHNGKSIRIKTFSGEEELLLQEFVKFIKANQGITMVFWNAPFDIPTIRKRFVINKLKDYLPDSLGNDSMKKPWTLKGILDLMDVWKGISYTNESMSEVAVAMGLPSPKQSMNGSEVSEEYYKRGISKIIEYNVQDVLTLINLYRVFTYKKPIEDVKIIETIPLKKTGLVEAVMQDEAIGEDDLDKVKEVVKEKGLDKNVAEDILTAAASPKKAALNNISLDE